MQAYCFFPILCGLFNAKFFSCFPNSIACRSNLIYWLPQDIWIVIAFIRLVLPSETFFFFICFRGEDIFISVWNLHHCPKHWDDAEVFNPERWPLDGPNPNEINQNFRFPLNHCKMQLQLHFLVPSSCPYVNCFDCKKPRTGETFVDRRLFSEENFDSF